MRSAEFARRFRDHQEIGREVTDSHLLVFFDNGEEVGVWSEDRCTTRGVGTVLRPDEAEKARCWYRNTVANWHLSEPVKHRNGDPSPHLPDITSADP